MQRRDDFVHDWYEQRYTMSELCERHGISRKTGYKWLNRVLREGAGDLDDRSRRPKGNSRSWSQNVVDLFLDLRRKHRTFGPKKLHAIVATRYPGERLPAVSTVGEWLRRNGMTQARRRRRRATPSTRPFHRCDRPNAVWCADFKGHFPVHKQRCHPLTIMDAHSRFLLAADALRSPSLEATRAVFERVFSEYGLPEAIRTDNGEPFASTALAGLSRLAVWFIKLGIRPERIEPGKPQQNGRHERMHRTLKAETATPPQPNFSRQQRAFDQFRSWYNDERPHEALAQTPPGVHYSPSERRYHEHVAELEYPVGYEQRRVQASGAIRWRGELIFVSSCLARERVGLKPVAFDRWDVYFGPLRIGALDESRLPWRVRKPGEEQPERVLPMSSV